MNVPVVSPSATKNIIEVKRNKIGCALNHHQLMNNSLYVQNRFPLKNHFETLH